MPDKIASFREGDAKLILATVKQLIASGYALPNNTRPPGFLTARQTQFVNESGEEIPPYACMQITEMETFGQNYCKVDKYDEDVFGGFLFNGHSTVAINGIGTAQSSQRFIGMREDNTDAVSIGELWGPEAGEWFLKPNGGPWQALSVKTESETETAIWLQADIATTYRAVVTTQVTARSGTTDGSGVVTLNTIGATAATATLQADVPVTSLLSDTIEINAHVVVARTTNGRLQVISEDCGA